MSTDPLREVIEPSEKTYRSWLQEYPPPCTWTSNVPIDRPLQKLPSGAHGQERKSVKKILRTNNPSLMLDVYSSYFHSVYIGMRMCFLFFKHIPCRIL